MANDPRRWWLYCKTCGREWHAHRWYAGKPMCTGGRPVDEHAGAGLAFAFLALSVLLFVVVAALARQWGWL